MENENIPAIGSLVDYGLDSWGKDPGKYVVIGWCKIATKHKDMTWIDEILFEGAAPRNNHKMEYCAKNEATHVILRGIAGTIAPITDCVVTGMVNWPKDYLEHLANLASQRANKHELLF